MYPYLCGLWKHICTIVHIIVHISAPMYPLHLSNHIGTIAHIINISAPIYTLTLWTRTGTIVHIIINISAPMYLYLCGYIKSLS